MYRNTNEERQNILLHYGFGTEAMKNSTVCPACGSLETVGKTNCSKCGEKLLKSSLFDVYKKQHKQCKSCETILADFMEFCPHCGMQISK